MRCSIRREEEGKGECSPPSHAQREVRERVAGAEQESGGAQSFSQLTEGGAI